MGLKDRNDILPQLNQLCLEIRVVISFRIRGVMEKGHYPVLRRAFKVADEPLGHGCVCGAAATHRVQAHEVNVCVIEGIVAWRTGWHPAGFSLLGKRKNM